MGALGSRAMLGRLRAEVDQRLGHRLQQRVVVDADELALDRQIERLGARLSGFLIQIFFNLPAIGILGYCGWLTLQSFFTGSYLSSDFFMHAFWAIGLVLFLSFFILQLCIRAVASTNRITARAFEKLKHRIDQLEELNQNPIKDQLNTVLALAALADSNRS